MPLPVPIAYDVTRLFLGPLSRTPRGIDRVELALANAFFFSADRDVVGVLPTAWGMRVFDGSRVRRGLGKLEAMWAENQSSETDPRLLGLAQRFKGEIDIRLATGRPMSGMQRMSRMAQLIGATGFSFGRSARKCVPEGAVYVNVGQILLAAPFFLRWLHHRPDVAPVFMLHDVIPLETPQYVAPSSARHHATMVKSAARYAAGMIVTTQHARDTVTAAIAGYGTTGLPTLVQPLPVADAFHGAEVSGPDLGATRYFVICGSIEPRKNHVLLLDVWRRLVEKLGNETPHLVIIGSAGWRGREILDGIENCAISRRYVHPISGLSSPALKQLIQGASALLMPSHNEGFGLPLVEARKLGVPVIASNIPAHLEVAAPGSCFLPVDDEAAWVQAILDCPGGSAMPDADDTTLTTAEDYGRAVAAFLDTCAQLRLKSGRHLPQRSKRATRDGDALRPGDRTTVFE